MSSELSVYIKKKNKPIEDKICLFWLGTTPARELYEVLPTTSYCSVDEMENGNKDFIQPLTNKMISDIIEFYDNQIMDDKKQRQEIKDRIAVYEDRIVKVDSKEVFNQIEQDINKFKNYIRYYDEEIEGTEYLKNKFKLANEMLEANIIYVKNNYEYECELYYSLD